MMTPTSPIAKMTAWMRRRGRLQTNDRTSEVRGSDADTVLRASNLMVRYRNGAAGIIDISFEVKKGQVVALLGPNGAGKTTSVRAVSGFLRPEGTKVVKGSIEFLGRDITNNEPHQNCKRGVAFVPERTKVFANMSVADNLISLGNLAGGAAQTEALRRVFDLFPVLEDRKKQIAGRLSGGQQQMLAIARALLTDPKLLILDEMTLGLHHSLHPPLFDAVRAISADGVSVVIVDESAHFALSVAEYCYILGGGKIREEGSSERFRGNELLAAGYAE